MTLFSPLVDKVLANRALRGTALLVLCAALPPEVLLGAVESSASTLLEAAPLLIAAEFLGELFAVPQLSAWGPALLGCGCGRLPGALSLPAAFFCALAFGPSTALLRWLGSLGLLFSRSRLGRQAGFHAHELPLAALDQLPLIAGCAFAGALFSSALRATGLGNAGTSFPAPFLFALGFGAGLLAPCTLGTLSLAASMRDMAPPAALGMLWSAGMAQQAAPGKPSPPQPKSLEAGFVYGCIALACGLVCIRGGAALLHPRLLPFAALGGVLAVAQALRTHFRVSYAMAPVIFLMLSGPLLSAPSPAYDARASTLENAFAGEHVSFTGMLARHAGRTMLFRYAITCCRADAAPIALRTERHCVEPDGTWIRATGTIVRDGAGLVLRVREWRRIPPPDDPFLYR